MTRTVAVIDLGTNTFNLLIARRTNTGFDKIDSCRIPVMLGKGTINEGYLSDEAISRGIKALGDFTHILKKHNIKEIRALATSAIRTAKNGAVFIEAARIETGIEIEIISGEMEAELIFCGNAAAAQLNDKNSLIMDIGGGSTEFIIGNRNGIIWKESYLLGAARLIQRFAPEDPISSENILKIENYLNSELQSLFGALNHNPVHELIGSSGAFDSFLEMMDEKFKNQPLTTNPNCRDYSFEEFNCICDLVIGSTRTERENIKGLIPMRVEMIVVAALFVQFVLKKVKPKQMKSTLWSLKEGALLQLFHQ